MIRYMQWAWHDRIMDVIWYLLEVSVVDIYFLMLFITVEAILDELLRMALLRLSAFSRFIQVK